MKFAIMGAGAMGSLIGGLLAQNNEDVTFVDPWVDHVNTINEKGLYMQPNGEEGKYVKVKATTNPSDVGIVDVIIFLVKGTKTDKSIRECAPMIGKDTIVFTLQNGIGNVEKIAEVVDISQVAFGVIEFSSVLMGPGNIRYQLADGQIFANTANKKANKKFEEAINRMNEAGINASISEDVEFRIWSKIVINANFNVLCAITGLTMGELMSQPAGMKLMEDITKEIVDVANKKGIKLEYDECMEHINGLGIKVNNHYPSMAQDVARKALTEIDFINGAVVREGKKVGVSTFTNETVVNILKVIENTYDEGKQFIIAK